LSIEQPNIGIELTACGLHGQAPTQLGEIELSIDSAPQLIPVVRHIQGFIPRIAESG
jgi:hypothetical protein